MRNNSNTINSESGMKLKIIIDQNGNSKVAIMESPDIIISDIQGALDLMATVQWEYDCNKIIINKSNITDDFFDLSTKLAGEILQKYVNYKVKLAIVGDFDVYNSQSLKEFIYESNKGRHVFFLKDQQNALQVLHEI